MKPVPAWVVERVQAGGGSPSSELVKRAGDDAQRPDHVPPDVRTADAFAPPFRGRSKDYRR